MSGNRTGANIKSLKDRNYRWSQTESNNPPLLKFLKFFRL